MICLKNQLIFLETYNMKSQLFKQVFCLGLFIVTAMSCSPSAEDADMVVQIHTYEYSTDELELMHIINNYRDSKGLNQLSVIDHISYLSAQHNQNMIQLNSVNHNAFVERSNELIQLYGAVDVGENVAYNYNSNSGVLNAWINSPSHKKILEGNFTHFGLSIIKGTVSGKKYYTNIFIKERQ